jgi:hypothetical protein
VGFHWIWLLMSCTGGQGVGCDQRVKRRGDEDDENKKNVDERGSELYILWLTSAPTWLFCSRSEILGSKPSSALISFVPHIQVSQSSSP